MNAFQFAVPVMQKSIAAAVLAASLLGVFVIAASARNNRAPAGAVILDVDTTTDTNAPEFQVCSPGPNDCSLRGAISKANSNPADDYTIALDASTYTLSLAGIAEDANATGDLDVTGNGTIAVTGVVSNTTVIQAGATPGSGIDRIFHILNDANLELNDLTVRHGQTGSYSFFQDRGAGVYLEAGSLVVTRCTITFGTSENGAGIFAEPESVGTVVSNSFFIANTAGTGGGAITAFSELTVISSAFKLNAASVTDGGAIYFDSVPATILNSSFVENEGTFGGAIMNQEGVLTVYNTSFKDNSADFGGAIFIFAPLELPTPLNQIHHSYFSGNDALSGGAIDVSTSVVGGDENYPAHLQVFYTTFEMNQTTDLEGKGGAVRNSGLLEITGSTFTENVAGGGGGAIHTDHDDFDAILTISNSTLSGNTSTRGGAISGEDQGVLTLTNTTISGNSAVHGGGIAVSDDISLHLINTIVAGSPQGGDCLDEDGNLVTNTANLIEDGTCSPAVTGDPMLGLLQDNGGPTQTMALLSGSPAIDQGNDGLCEPLDQRGFLRIPPCDIGAFEVDVVSFLFNFLPIVIHN